MEKDFPDFKVNVMSSANSRKKVDKMFIAQASDFIVKNRWEIEWSMYAQMYGFDEIMNELPRFLRSQFFRDPDYPANVLAFLNKCYEVSSERTIAMAMRIVRDIMAIKGIKEEDLRVEYPAISAYLKGEIEILHIPLTVPTIPDYLLIQVFPDEFYKALAQSINLAYKYGLYTATIILIRKMLENLLIDILRKKYGMKDLDLFFDRQHGRFKMFNELIRNFEKRLQDFRYIEPRIEEALTELKNMREECNAAAHSLEKEIGLKRESLDNIREKVNFLVSMMIRVYNNIS
jgi:hypothetical protein